MCLICFLRTWEDEDEKEDNEMRKRKKEEEDGKRYFQCNFLSQRIPLKEYQLLSLIFFIKLNFHQRESAYITLTPLYSNPSFVQSSVSLYYCLFLFNFSFLFYFSFTFTSSYSSFASTSSFYFLSISLSFSLSIYSISFFNFFSF